jgi:GNAT superfamily N-acetyltransferase
MAIEVLPATTERFDDVAALLAPKREGADACWCLAYHLTSAENNALHGAERPAALRKLCSREPAPGMVAYADGAPVGWMALGPRSELGRLRRSRTIPAVDDLPVWSVVCFVVRVGHRGKGIAGGLLEAGVHYAKDRGAPAIEGYPVDPQGARISGSLAYVGTTGLFERAGFRRMGETASRSAGMTRWLMRRDL